MKGLLGDNMKNSSNKQKQVMTGNSKLGEKVVYDSLKLANGLPVSQYGTNYSKHTYRLTVR